MTISNAVLPSLPRLAPHAVGRPKIETWLKQQAEAPLRLLAAPAGSGKTTAIVSYLRGRARAHYLAIQPGERLRSVRQRLIQALGLERVPASFAELVTMLRRAAPLEIAIDDLSLASDEVLEEIDRLVNDSALGSWIVATRSRAVIDASRALANGSAVLCDASMLDFDADETMRLAEELALAVSPADAAHVLRESEGWAIATAALLRSAAETGRAVHAACEEWFRQRGRVFAEFIRHELERVDEHERAAFRRMLAGARSELAELEMRGLFVRYDESGYRPYRMVARLLGEYAATAGRDAAPPQPIVVKMFGRFEAEIEGRPIPWVRRRDQDLFKYLLLKPHGSASRGELIETFWRSAEPHLAGQSLRTACANLRKAIGAIVGADAVERYLSTGSAISLALSNVVLDLRRFRAHVSQGDEAYERARYEEAITHYRAAEALYRGDLLQEDVQAPWLAPSIAIYRELYLHGLGRQGDCWLAKGEFNLARQCALALLRIEASSADGRRLLTAALAPPAEHAEGRSLSAPVRRRACARRWSVRRLG